MEGIGLEAVEDHLSSDSLTSALINAASILYGPEGASRMVDALGAETPAFVLSSLFPYGPDPADSKKTTEALVKPLIDPPMEKDSIGLRKEFKRLRYLHPEDFLLWLQGNPLDARRMEDLLKRSSKLTNEWWKKDLRPRVALDRESQGSSIWNQGALFFAREEKDESGGLKKVGAGLYGLVRFADLSWKKILEETFRLLGDTGLGGERTYGLGFFEFGGFEPLSPVWEKILALPPDRVTLLSVYYPRDDERKSLGDFFEAWEIRERRGYIVSGRDAKTIKRKRIRMIAEGSVCRKSLRGALADVTPENPEDFGLGHKIFRSGLAFHVPLGGNR